MTMHPAFFTALFLASSLSINPQAQAQDTGPVSGQYPARSSTFTDLKAAATVDLLFPVSLEDGRAEENKLFVRSADLLFYGSIDPIFDGLLNISAHPDEGETKFDIHEAYISSSRLIPFSRVKAGKFLLGVGRLNQFHAHDWPFTTAPKVQREFFTPNHEDRLLAESATDAGLEYSVLLPLPFYVDLTLGLTNGYCLGHCEGEQPRSRTPLHYVHPVTFFSLSETSGIQVGASYLSLTEASSRKTTLVGLDLTYKSRRGRMVDWLVQSEVWHRSLDFEEAPSESALGGYVFTEYGFFENISFGLRLDGYSVLNKSSESGERQRDLDWAISPQATYQASEFSKIRLTYAHEVDTTEGEADAQDRRIELQFIYFLGAHPSHDF